jgi:hypothetical protein
VAAFALWFFDRDAKTAAAICNFGEEFVPTGGVSGSKSGGEIERRCGGGGE